MDAHSIQSDSPQSLFTGLNLFTPLMTQKQIQDSTRIYINTDTNLQKESKAISFTIPAHPDYFLSPDLMLRLKLKVTNKDGTDLADDANVGIINNMASSLFNAVQVYLNKQPVFGVEQFYGYTSYLHVLLQTSAQAQNTIYQEAGFYPDTGDFNSALSANTNTNTGFIRRCGRTKKSTEIELTTPIHTDLTLQPRPILNNTEVSVILYRASDSFCLMQEDDTDAFKVVITSAQILAKLMTLTPGALQHLETRLSKRPANYPIVRTDVRPVFVAANTMNVNTTLFEGTLPSIILIVQVSEGSFVGSRKKNPYHFQHMNLSRICLDLADRSFPAQGLDLDFKSDFISAGYLDLFLNSYRSMADTNINITRAQFISGYTILSFNLCKDLSFGDAIASKPFVGSLKLRASWSEALKENTVLLAVGFYESNLYLNSNRLAYLSTQ